MTAVTVTLGRAVSFAIGAPLLIPTVNVLIDELLNNFEVFGKCLSSGKPSLANPILRLMTYILRFNNGEKIDALLESLDSTLKVLPKLAIPSKLELMEPSRCQTDLSVRGNFVRFWITLCSAAAPLARRGLLTANSKVMSNIFKYIAIYDTEDLQKLVLNFLDSAVLMEPTYKKMTKCKIIGDWVISKLVELYSVDQARDQLQALLSKMCTDDINGLVFNDDKVWFSGSSYSSYSSSSSDGAIVSVGNRTFRIYNKLIYTLLTNLKPWADDLQLELVVSVIDYIPELLPAYNYYCFFTNGAHDPKLSSFYMGQSLLLLRLIELPVPKQFIKCLRIRARNNVQSGGSSSGDSDLLLASTVIEAICPSQLTRSALSQGMSSEYPLIVHLNAVLIIATFQKLDKMLKALSYDDSTNYTDLKNELIDILDNQRLPVLGTVIGSLNECSKRTPERKVLLLNNLKVAEYYHRVLGQSGNIQLSNINLGQSDEEFKGIDLAILNCYLQLTADSPEQNKWWNVSKGSKNTLFTSLLRLPYRLESKDSAGSITDGEIADILSNLVRNTLVFNDFRSKDQVVLDSQVYALLLSLREYSASVHNDEEVDKVCKILDESISRCVRAPYKYIDLAGKFSPYLSPFYVALLEQSKFTEGSPKSLFEWIKLSTRYLFLLGEPLDAMKRCLEEYWDSEVTIDFDLTSYEAFIGSSSQPEGLSFSEAVFNLSSSNLEKRLDAMVPMSDVDLVALISRCNTLVHSNSLSLTDIEGLLTSLISKIGNYVIQKFDAIIDTEDVTINSLNLLDPKYWRSLYLDGKDSITDKRLFISSLFNEMFHTLCEESSRFEFDDYRSVVFGLLKDVTFKGAQDVLQSSLWILKDGQISELLVEMKRAEMTESLLQIAATRHISISSAIFMQLLSRPAKQNSHTLSQLAKGVEFAESDVDSLLSRLDESMYPVLIAVVSSHGEFSEKVGQAALTEADKISKTNEGLQFLEFLSTKYLELSDYVFDRAIDQMKAIITSEEISSGQPVDVYLKIIAENPKLMARDDAVKMVSKLLELDSFKNDASLVFSKEFVEVILRYVDSPVVLNPWLYRATLYVTRMFSETAGEIPIQFREFLKSLELIPSKYAIWRVVPKGMLNSQLESILSRRWIQDIDILKYVIWIVMSDAGKVSSVEVNKMLQIFINNEEIMLRRSPTTKKELELRYYSSLLIQRLFSRSPKTLSTVGVQQAILKFHLGSTRPDDKILRDVLAGIERQTESSWINYVSDWEFRDEGYGAADDEEDEGYALRELFFVKSSPTSGANLSVILRKSVVDNTIGNFKESEGDFAVLPEDRSLSEWTTFFENSTMDIGEKLGKKDFLYDSEFLMLSIINNEELFKIKNNEANISLKPLIESNLLQLVVMNLANSKDTVRDISKRILYSVMVNIEGQIKEAERLKEERENGDNEEANSHVGFHPYKERLIMKLFFSNLLNMVEAPEEDGERLAPLIIVFLSHLIRILVNPSHFMYEKVYRFMLGAPTFRAYEIPLFKAVMRLFTRDTHASTDTDNTEDYYRRLIWFLDTLRKSITTSEDLRILRKSGFLDTLLNLTSSPFIHLRVHTLIIEVLLKIAQFPNGADLLIRSSGLMAFLEEKGYTLNESGNCAKLTRDSVSNDLLLVNYQRLAAEAQVSSDCNGSNKRIREWSKGDLERSVKRILTKSESA
ncbi:DEKNAAC102789 [Brettanomyces naardenensis]|uniref:DEKNAAC102789 n=1 Tax=Brettanomyces naardenensis TaxID=13370 RepID=A0A448YLG6_BRENA|nr:DEKNAAC102789 [Brettanomyces naardenensis]